MNIAVTGLNNVDNPGPGVPVIRGIKDAPEFSGKIIGLMYDSLEPGAYMKNVTDKNYLIPYPAGGLEPFFERLKFIHSKEKIDIIIPTLDAELYAFIKLEPRLNQLGIRMFLPTLEHLNLRSKDKLSSFCNTNNIVAPRSLLINSLKDIHKIPVELSFPIAIKGIFYDAYIANNIEEAQSYFKKISSKWGLPIIAQEFIKGEEYNVVVLGDGKGGSIGSIPMKKLFVTDKGKGWAGVTIEDQTLLDTSAKIIASLGWKGGAELEFVKEKGNNKFYLLEINPRFPAWVYLAVAAGQNLPFALYKLAMEKEVDKFETYEVGKIFIRYSWDLITDMKKFEQITVQGELNNG
jgi:carbamoyl-phosphate synthase large subunit